MRVKHHLFKNNNIPLIVNKLKKTSCLLCLLFMAVLVRAEDIEVPGVVGITLNDTITSVTISQSFSIHGLEIEPDNLTLAYESNVFSIYGGATVKVGTDAISVSLGSDSDAGIIIDNGSVTHVNFGLTADFSMHDLTFAPDNLTFEYDKVSSQYEMYGSLTVSVGSDDIIASLGDADDPGFVIENGVLKHINIGITENFSLGGLDIDANPVGMKWDGGKNYAIWGDILLSIASESIEADIGTGNSPGIVIKNGALHSFEATVNSDFKLGGLEVEVHNTTVGYGSGKFHLKGILKATELWSVEFDLGQDGGVGLEIDVSGSSNKFKLDDFAIEVDNVGLGAVDINELRVSFADNTIHEAIAKVTFPPGWEVDADLLFSGNPAKLDGIDIAFVAHSIETAISIGDTGFEVVYIEGDIQNLTLQTDTLWVRFPIFDPFKGIVFEMIPVGYIDGIYFKGSIGITFGGPFSLAGKSASLFYNMNTVEVTNKSLALHADVLVGAYNDGHKWHSILGDGHVSAHLVWNDYYKVTANINVPGDPYVIGEFAAKVTNSGNFGALAKVTLKVPNSVPVIGGDKLGSVSGGFRYIHNSLHSSYAAGWTSYWFFGKHHVGAKYNLGSRHVSVIGSGTIDDINKQLKHASGLKSTSGSWVKDANSFEFPERKTSMIVQLDFGKIVDSAYVSIFGPDGFYDLKEIDITHVGDSLVPIAEIGEDFNLVENDSTATFLIVNHFPDYEDKHQYQTTLNPGRYDILISYKNSENVDSVDVKINHFIPNPYGTISASEAEDGSIDLDLSFWSHHPDSSMIHLYMNTDSAYEGSLFGVTEFGIADEDGYGSLQVKYYPKQIPHGDSIYFYFSVEDSTNVPFFSEITTPITYKAPLRGKIETFEADSIFHGWKVFLDLNGNGSHDKDENGTYEPSTIANQSGDYYFDNLTPGIQYNLDLVLPAKYQLAGDSENEFPKVFTFDGTPLDINFKIEEK